jgi:hypothetical protein
MLTETLGTLTSQARALGLTDTEWSARAGLRKETLSRLRHRQTCDLKTLLSLARVVGARLAVLDLRTPATTPDGHFPAGVDREYEEKLVDLCASGDVESGRWASRGPSFFMAGLAVMMASVHGYDRRSLLALAERLHPGATEVAVFSRWLERSPVRPTRFLSLLDGGIARAARP